MKVRGVFPLWVALGVLVVLRLFLMAWVPLADTTEARYAEIGRKMVELGDWVTPWHDYGVPFWGKPAFSFWATAAGFKWLGVNEFAARLPHFLMGLATVWSLWNVARLRQALEGWLTAAVLGSALLFYVSSGAVMTDAALVWGTTLSMTGVWLAMTAPQPAQRQRQAALAFVGGAIGLLAKGPLALVLIGAPLVVWATWNGRWRAVWRALPWVRGLLAMMLVSAPWFVIAEIRTPGFLDYFVVGEHFHRFLTPGWTGDLYGHAHPQPKGQIWLFAAAACLPWTLWMPLWIWRSRYWARHAPAVVAPTPEPVGPWAITDREARRYVALWGLMPLLFFTVSSNIIWTYVLPAMPALAWWAGRRLGRYPVQGLRWSLWGVVSACLLWGGSALVVEHQGNLEAASAKGLVQVCRQAAARHAPDGSPPLVVLMGRPSFSSQFYTQGRAVRVDSLDELGDRWPAFGLCLAAKVEDPDAKQAVLRGGQVVEDLGVHHDRQTWWVRRAGP